MKKILILFAHIVARARNRHDVYDLYQAGATDIIRETFDSACRAARSALEGLGYHPYEAEKVITAFVTSDRYALRKLADVYDPEIPITENKRYVEAVKAIAVETKDAMGGVRNEDMERLERAWRPPPPTYHNPGE